MLRNMGCDFGFTFMVEGMDRKEPIMFCRSCGTPLVDDALFCPVCGAPVAPDRVAAARQPQPAAPAPQQYVPVQQPARRKRSKKPLIALAAVLAVAAGIGGGALFYFTQVATTPIDEKTFPDSGMRALVSTKYDTNGDGRISRDEAKAVTSVELDGVASTQGLGKVFPNVVSVESGGDKLVNLDLSGCGDLTTVDLNSASNVTVVNLDGCDNIEKLDLKNAQDLKSIDLSGKKKLATLALPQDTKVSGIKDTQLDELWLPVSYEGTDKSGQYGDIYEIERDKNGYVTGYATAVKQGGGMSYSVEHDESHRVSEIKETRAGGYVNINTFTYDADGNVARIDSDGDISDASSTTTFTYDADGNLIDKTTSAGYGESSSTFVYQGGNLVTDTETSPANPRTVVYSYGYDKGRVTSFTTDSQGDTAGTRWTLTLNYEYDEDGNISRVSPVAYDTHGNDYGSLSSSFAAVDYSYIDGKIDRIESERGGYAEFYYDDHGNLTSVDEYVGRGSDAEFEFEHEVEYRRYFCNKHEKNKPEEWIRLDSQYDVDHGSWSNDSDYGRECFADVYRLNPLTATPNPFLK